MKPDSFVTLRDPRQASVRHDWHLQVIRANDACAEIGLVVNDASGPLTIGGAVKGPYCPYATTLLGTYPWSGGRRGELPEHISVARLYIEDACLWEPEHPFLYRGQWTAKNADYPESPVSFGARILSASDSAIRINGRAIRVRGLSLPNADSQTLETLHEHNCNWLLLADGEWTAEADEYGPFVFGVLPSDRDDAVAAVRNAGPQKPSLGAWFVDESWSIHELDRLRHYDRSTLFAQKTTHDKLPENPAADLLVVSVAESELANVKTEKAWMAVVETDRLPRDRFDADAWAEEASKTERATADLPNCVGWILRGAK